jgi:chemotaxis protein MotB
MKLIQLVVVVLVTGTLMVSCVSTKKFNAKDAELTKARNDLNDCQTTGAKGQIANKKLSDQVKDLQTQVDTMKQAADAAKAAGNNNQLINTLKDMNIISPDQAQSIDQSLKSITSSGDSKDALNTALVSNLKNAIGVQGDTDISVMSSKGNIYIDISDHMYFSSGSSELSAHAKSVLEKIAKILNAHPDMHFMIEGHTDNKPMHSACVPDNWDLSIRRATSVVRLLQKEYKVDPSRMIAAGHGEYEPVEANDTAEHRAKNRRISIILTPQLDQFFKLLGK